MAKSKTKPSRRRLVHTSLKELRSINSVAAALRIVDQYGAAESDFLLEVCLVLAEIADRLASPDFSEFSERCLAEHGALFRSTEHMKVMLEVGRGGLPDKALKVAFMRGIGASYLNMLRIKMDRGGITRAKLDKVIDKALEIADPRPLSDALGFTKAKIPLKKGRRTVPFVSDAELDDKGVLWAITSTGMRYRISREDVVKKIQQLWRTKKKRK